MDEKITKMQGMAVGGVDPSILRELSGVYKPFIKAFKALDSFDEVYAGERPGFIQGYEKLKAAIVPWGGA